MDETNAEVELAQAGFVQVHVPLADQKMFYAKWVKQYDNGLGDSYQLEAMIALVGGHKHIAFDLHVEMFAASVNIQLYNRAPDITIHDIELLAAGIRDMLVNWEGLYGD